jgi:hypothetical protein
MLGAVAGTPGTPPTYWTVGAGSGISKTILGVGSENGISYIDVEFAGTTTALVNLTVGFSNAGIAGTQNQTWTLSGYVKLVSGSFGSYTQSPRWVVNEADSGSHFLTQGLAPFSSLPSGGALASQRYLQTYTIANSSTVAISPFFQIQYNSGQTIDFALRFGLPQFELGSFPTSVIPTSGTAVTRQADNFTIPTGGWYRAGQGTLSTVSQVPYIVSSYPVTASLSNSAGNSLTLFASDKYSGVKFDITASGNSVFGDISYNHGQYHGINAIEKSAFAFQPGDQRAATLNILLNSGTVSSIPTFNTLYLGNWSGFGLNGWLRRVWYMPTREPDAALLDYTR